MMSFLKKRIPMILVVIGITLLLTLYLVNFSSTLTFSYPVNHNIEDDGLTGYMFKAQNDIFIRANEREGHRFSLYVFDLNVTTSEVDIQIPQNGTALIAVENVTSLEVAVVIPKNGFYLIYVTPANMLPITVRATIIMTGLNFTIFLIGIITLGTGVFILFFNEILPVLTSGPKEDAAPAGS